MELEPAERNPAELRKTAIKLVIFMVIGAATIITAYLLKERSKSAENLDRPPIIEKLELGKLAKFIDQNGEVVDFSDFFGKIWFAVPFSHELLDENKHALEAMSQLQEHYGENENVRFVYISIDGKDDGVNSGILKAAAEKLDALKPRTYFLTAETTKDLRRFLRKDVLLGVVMKGEGDRKWKFPSEVAILDKGLHLRSRYDFKMANEWQAKARNEPEKIPKLKDEKDFDKFENAVEILMNQLHKDAKFLLEETQIGSRK